MITPGQQKITPLAGALAMAAKGFAVFPLKAGTKDGHLFKSWKAAATADPARIATIAKRYPGCNWGMRCAGHLVLDVDTADGKQGEASLVDLDLAHGLPDTRAHSSARGGQHIFMKLPPGLEVTNRDAPLGPGLNVRGGGGYVVCPGSTFAGRPYGVLTDAAIADAPASLVALLKAAPAARGAPIPTDFEDNPADVDKAVSWLQSRLAAEKGSRGSEVYKAAARCREWGLSQATALDAIAEHFGERMDPPADAEFCAHEVASAYRNAQNTVGVRSTAVDFEDVADFAAGIQTACTAIGAPVPAAGACPAALGHPISWPATVEREDKPPRVLHNDIDNIEHHLAHTGTAVWHDCFAGKTYMVSAYFGLDGEVTDAGLNAVRLHAYKAGLEADKGHYVDVVTNIAFKDKRHPVRDYLAGLKWDGVPRLAKLFAGYTGSPDTPLNAAAGTLLMVAAVRRVRQPGVKYDYMTVLEGPQGSGKSGFIGVLGKGWAAQNFDLGDKSREIIEQTGGSWVVEVPELKGMATPRGQDHVKALITTTEDRARAAHAHFARTVPRQWVLIATTNDRRYLADPTGNRRFLPVVCPRTDFPALKRDLDQLWAEAAAVEPQYGAELELPAAVIPALRKLQGERVTISTVREVIETAYGGGGDFYVTVPNVWKKLDPFRRPSETENRALSDVMTALGFEFTRRPRMGTRQQPNVWVRRSPGGPFPEEFTERTDGAPPVTNLRVVVDNTDADAVSAAAELCALLQ